MKFLLLLLVMLTSCAASPQDMSGKMFTFPQSSNTARVTLTTSQEFNAITVCQRFITDLKRDHGLFSMSTSTNSNTFLIIWNQANQEMEPHVREVKSVFMGLDYKPNMWHSLCTTWNSTFGLVQLWFDGQPSVKKYVTSGSSIRGSTIITLGQEQDSHGGGFDLSQSFTGMMSDVHMWDYVLSPCEIQKYMDGQNFTPGNVLNWSALEFQIVDRVLIEDKNLICY